MKLPKYAMYMYINVLCDRLENENSDFVAGLPISHVLQVSGFASPQIFVLFYSRYTINI